MTQGGARDRERRGRRHAGRAHHVLREALRPFDRRGRSARPEDRDSVLAQRVGEPADERRLGPDDDEVDAELTREREHAFGVLGPYRMAVGVPRDPGIAGRAVELRRVRALREPPRERMLAPARPDEEHFHARRV